MCVSIMKEGGEAMNGKPTNGTIPQGQTGVAVEGGVDFFRKKSYVP